MKPADGGWQRPIKGRRCRRRGGGPRWPGAAWRTLGGRHWTRNGVAGSSGCECSKAVATALTPADDGWKRGTEGQRRRGRGGAPPLAGCGVADVWRASLDEGRRSSVTAEAGSWLCSGALLEMLGYGQTRRPDHRKGVWLWSPRMGRQIDGGGSRQNAHNGGVHHCLPWCDSRGL